MKINSLLVFYCVIFSGFCIAQGDKPIPRPKPVKVHPNKVEDPRIVPLQAIEISRMKRGKGCVYIHLWATWCQPCLEELPLLMTALPKLLKEFPLKPIVIDVSPKFQQEHYSKKFMLVQDPAFEVYTNPSGNDEAYIKSVDSEWSGSLPFSVLYKNKKKVKTWKSATTDMKAFSAEIRHLCR